MERLSCWCCAGCTEFEAWTNGCKLRCLFDDDDEWCTGPGTVAGVATTVTGTTAGTFPVVSTVARADANANFAAVANASCKVPVSSGTSSWPCGVPVGATIVQVGGEGGARYGIGS